MFEISIVLNEIQENSTKIGGTKTERTFTRSGIGTRQEALEFLKDCAKELFPEEEALR